MKSTDHKPNEVRGNPIRYLVTGGCGFLGRHIVDELAADGGHVTVLDRRDSIQIRNKVDQFLVADIRDTKTVLEAVEKTDVVFHLSGILGTSELFEDPKKAIDVNVTGAINVLDALRGSRNNPRVFLPGKPNEWNNIYSVTSQAVEKLGHTYREAYGIDVRILRIHNLYGPGQDLYPVRKFVPYCIVRALNDEAIEIFGDGSQEIQLQYVADVAKLVNRFMSFEGIVQNTYELRPQTSMTVTQFARKIIELIKSKSVLKYVPMRLGEQTGIEFADTDSLETLFTCMNQSTPITEGLIQTLDWYRKLPTSTPSQARIFHEQA